MYNVYMSQNIIWFYNLLKLRDIIVAVQPPGQEDIGKALESYTFRIKYSDACNFESNTTFANSR